jgi:hypothetical protein
VVLQPGQAFGFANRCQAAANRSLADNLAHAEQRRVHRIAAQRGDMRVAAMPGQHRQQHGAEQVALLRRIRTGERKRTVRHPGVEQPGLFEVVDEEGQLPERRDWRRRVPPNMHPTGKGVRYR